MCVIDLSTSTPAINAKKMLLILVTAVARVSGGQCPLKTCEKRAKEVLLQENEPNYAIPYSTEARVVNQVAEIGYDGMSLYNVDYKPLEFTCTACDESTCEGCNLMCDLSKCVGTLYQEECWCRQEKDVEKKTPMWKFRDYDSRFLVDDSVHRFFCDNKCQKGQCGIKSLQCKKREEACQPWWWCNKQPPLEEKPTDWPSDEFRESFLQKRTAKKPKVEKNDIYALKFVTGRWECGSGSLPPKIRDPVTYFWVDRGYIVFEKSSCKGSSFEKKCHCWDNVKYLRGEDPGLTTATCDNKCLYGECEGRTCACQPPPKFIPEPNDAPMDVIAIEEAGQKDLNNHGPSMDPVDRGHGKAHL